MKKIFVLIALLSLLSGTSRAGYWLMESHLPQGPIDDMAVTGLQISGSTMIAVIGGNTGGTAINGVYYYDVANQLWHDNSWGIPQYPHLVYGLAATTVTDSIYPNGGYLQDLAAYGDTTYYQSWASGWYPIPGLVLQTPRMNHGLVYIEPDLYAVGGTRFGGAVDSTVERLNLGAHTVSGATPMPQSRTEAVVAKALGADGEEHIYVIGGRTNSGAILNSVIEYDTAGAGGSWSGKTSMPGPGRWMATGAVLNNKIYVMGGTIDLSGTTTRRVDVYDPQNNSWALGDSLPLSLIRAGAYGVNNVIYFFGGFDKGMNSQTDSVWLYHPLAPDAPLLIQPLHNTKTNNQYPEFYWGSVPGCSQYRIQITSDPSFSSIDIADVVTADTSRTYPSIYVGMAGEYFWRVKSYDWSVPDSSKWSPVRRFILDLTPPEQPIPSLPSDGSFTNSLSSVNFSWFAVDSIMSYHLQVFKGDTNTSVYNIYDLGNNYTTLDFSMYGEGQYLWRVEAKDSAGNFSGYHSIQTFTIDQTAPLLILTYPFNGNIGIDPNDDIVLVFSEMMNPTTFTFSCNPDPGNWTYNWSTTGDTVYIGHAVFPSNSTITVSINAAQDLAGNTFALNGHVNPWSFTTKADDMTPPVISVPNTNYGQLFANSGINFSVNIIDNAAMGQVTLYWGPAGYNGYTSDNIMSYNSSSGNYECYIPGADILPRGLQYQVVASDSAGNYSYYPAMSDYYIHSVHFPGQPITAPVLYDKWQMISIPTDARNTNIFNQLAYDEFGGSYNKEVWRLYIWGNGNYGEITSASNGYIQELGQAYWLRHRTTVSTLIYQGPDSSYGNFKQSKPCSLALDPGWNDVGTPFMFNIDWMNVVIPGMVAGPYHYDGTQWRYPSEVFAANMDFEPCKGFSFRNDNSYTTYLEIYPTAVNKSGKTSAIKQPDGWQAAVTVENGAGWDKNSFGLSSDASVQPDRYDYPEPPAGLTGASGYFRLANDHFCTDIRPEIGEGQVWDFAVECNGSTKLAVTLPAEFPAGMECFLADLARQISINISGNEDYEFIPESGELTREFRIIVGSSEYAQQVLGRTFSVPTATVLGQNLPNPFSGRTSISFQLAAEGRVKIAVYNVAGQLIRTLLDQHQMTGRYSVVWDGKDQAGHKASAGLYFYQLQTPDRTVTRRMALVR